MGVMKLAFQSEEVLYLDLQDRKLQEWEDTCLSCGMCCGVKDGDPCEHLTQEDGRYRCRIYSHRFGLHQTRQGREFRCVPIRNILHQSWPGDSLCAYKKNF